MKFNRPLAPGIIKKLDEKLLLNNPDTWSSRAHMIIYYSILFMLALAGICFIVPDDPRSRSAEELWITFVGLIVFLGFIVWMIYLLRFNVFKRFGNLEPFNALKTFLLYFLSIALMICSTLIPPAIQTIRANMAYSSEELVSDVNAINSKVLLLEHDSIPRRWLADTFIVVNSLGERHIITEDEYYITNAYGERIRKIIDTAEFNRRAPLQDSVYQLNDSMFVFLECPDYMFVSDYNLSSSFPDTYLGSQDLYYRYVKSYKTPDKIKTIEELRRILRKYHPRLSAAFENDPDDDVVYSPERGMYMDKIKDKYDLYTVDRNITNITSRKYWWAGYTVPTVSRIIYYITLALSLLVIIFRRTTVRTFFLTLLAAILITIITSLILAFSGTDAITLLILLLAYYVVFGLLAFTMPGGRTRNVFNGISLNLFVFMTAFVPLIGVALYYQVLRDIYEKEHYTSVLFENENRNLFFGEIGGLFLLLLLMAFLFKRLYRTWYALPEQ